MFNNAVNANQSGFQSLTSGGVWNGRTLTAGAGISISNADGTAGNPTISSTATGAAGYVLFMSNTIGNPVDATVYYIAQASLFNDYTGANNSVTRLYCPIAGTITTVYGNFNTSGTLGSNQNATLAVRLNDTTDTTISSTIQLTANNVAFNNTGLSIAVAAGDFISFKFTGPTWSTNPTQVSVSVTAFIAT